MPRVAGVDIPNNRPVWIALRYIHGIGPTKARQICDRMDIPDSLRAKDLTEDQIAHLGKLLTEEFVIEGNLRRQVKGDIDRLKQISCYRGLRHRRGLPVRGQRTKTNARTRKGPRKTVAGKKSVKEMR
ncbi:MAG: 30S ribosomal protein S13 [Phycisphaerales bacterium]|jgi:small subunit ribosomal protein S13|nr:30S ribosomal protein S13 [Phycisphaerales bacterium]MBT7171585.1 30S ribosomal protein S13 [Phycisphaerales bacterium]